MRSRLRVTAARLYFPLARLALCADCEACFEIGADACPACGGRSWSPLSRLIGQQASDGAVVRAVRAVVAETRGNGASRGDAHHLVIVSREQPKLFEMLRRELQATETVTVIQDRRGKPQPAPSRMNLRWRNVDRQIAAMGWAIVRSDLTTSKR